MIPVDAVSGLYFGRAIREDKQPRESENWRTDNSQEFVDYLHSIPGSDPFRPPDALPHFYGATGHGRLRNPIREPRASHIFFVVKDDDGNSELIFQTSDATWQAYNGYGGLTTYGSFRYPWTHGPKKKPMEVGKPMPRAFKASYNRPLLTRGYRNVNNPLHAEYPAIRFLERNGYDVSYMSGVDVSRSGPDRLLGHRVFLSVGHDEYVSLEQRRAVESARNEGVHLMFWSANEFYWSIRWEPSLSNYDVTNNYTNPEASGFRTLVCYKESQSSVKLDPLEGSWTGTFRDSRPINPRGPMPENELIGQIYTVNAQRVDSLVVPGGRFSRLRFWRNTSIAALAPGSRYVSFRGVLGHEWDEDIDNGHRPEGLIHLSETWVDNVQMVQDHGSVFDSASARHTLTLYRAQSGALVFGSGSVQWAWALDGHHDINDAPRANKYSIRVETDTVGPDRDLQQSMINMFADMGVQPTTLQNDLKPAQASQDDEAPHSWLLSVKKPDPAVLEVSASAQDKGGGCVAGMEVSLDGGSRWHPALGTGSEIWIYWYNLSELHQTLYEDWEGDLCRLRIAVRAIDDSGNIGNVSKATDNYIYDEHIRRKLERCSKSIAVSITS